MLQKKEALKTHIFRSNWKDEGFVHMFHGMKINWNANVTMYAYGNNNRRS